MDPVVVLLLFVVAATLFAAGLLYKKIGWSLSNVVLLIVPVVNLFAIWSLVREALTRGGHSRELVWLVYFVPFGITGMLVWLLLEVWPEEREFGRWWTR